MLQRQSMDRGIRILGGSVLICLCFINDEVLSPGKIAAVVVGLYGLLTGIINFCPLTQIILKEKKMMRKKATETAPVKIGDARELSFFEDFTDDEIAKVLARCRLRQYPGGMEVVEEGKHKRVFSIIYSGNFKIVKAIADGETKIIGTMSDGETYGERSFFSPLPPSVSVFTMEDAKVLEINEEDFRGLIADEPGLGIKIVSRLLMVSSARITALHEQIASIGNLVVQSRQHLRETPR